MPARPAADCFGRTADQPLGGLRWWHWRICVRVEFFQLFQLFQFILERIQFLLEFFLEFFLDLFQFRR